MRVLFCSPEVTPYAKTGGLADVSGALPVALRELGVQCDVVMPCYGHVKASGRKMEKVTEIFFPMGGGIAQATILRHGEVYFIDNDEHFGRGELYAYASMDFPDNLERFAFFSRACVELIRFLEADIVHCNDWQTALIPAYMNALEIQGIVTVFTIHNLAYQGLFDVSLWPILFLPWEFFNPSCMEYYGRINVMKTGIVFSDMINTVSLTYAQEIQRPEYGVGLDGLLRSVSYKLTGITNGIDIKVWDPGQDSFIPSPYRLEDLRGKADCKEALQKRFSLDVRADIPLFGLISRLVEQKGVDLVLNIIPEMIREGCQIVILGNGDAGYEELLRGLAGVFPERCGVFIGFDEVLAHAIEAGSDFFLMPSRFEPCGLNQMISMRYGSIPIVTPVGGLMDTVRALGEGEKPCGIRVLGTDSRSLLDAVREAVRIFWTKPKLMAEMKKNAMKKDVSWTGPAKQYFDMYRKQKDLKESRRF